MKLKQRGWFWFWVAAIVITSLSPMWVTTHPVEYYGAIFICGWAAKLNYRPKSKD